MMLDLRNKRRYKTVGLEHRGMADFGSQRTGHYWIQNYGMIGVWVRTQCISQMAHDKKIAALGLRVKKWVTFHGLSLNVNPNLAFSIALILVVYRTRRDLSIGAWC